MNTIPLKIKSFEINRPDFDCQFEFGILKIDSLGDLDVISTEILSEIEFSYYKSISHINRQKSFIAGRFLAKSLIAKRTEIQNFKSIQIEKGAFGQPILRPNNNLNLQLSISHSDNWAVAMCFNERHPMAIDVEDQNEQKIKVLQRSFDLDEKLLLNEIGGSTLLSELSYLSLGWTLKESLSKVLKTGLTSPLELYKIKSIENLKLDYTDNLKQIQSPLVFSSRFKNFTQYQGLSFKLGESFCSWVMPYKSGLNYEELVSFLNEVT